MRYSHAAIGDCITGKTETDITGITACLAVTVFGNYRPKITDNTVLLLFCVSINVLVLSLN